MTKRSSIAACGLLALCASISGAAAADDAKYPGLRGQWDRVGVPRWVQAGQKAPLTPEYQKVYDANLADMAGGGQGNVPSWYCLPQGMPMMMNAYDPVEFVVTPDITYVLISHVNDSYRRIYTDGRKWPDDLEPAYAGYSIGKWEDTDGDGRYDTLTVETRGLKGPRATRLVRHGRQIFLQIGAAMLDMFAAIRERCARIMREGGAIPETS